jgi:heat shock protein HtpX
LLLFGLLSLLVGPVVAYIMVALTSRYREYLADASAAQLTQDPEALIRALKEIEKSAGSSTILKSNIAHLCIIDPLNRTATSKEGWFADILAAHPPTSKRILALQSMTFWSKPAPAGA